MKGTHGAITEAESLVRLTEREYLKRFGWEYTCATPGSLWLWRRNFADKHYGGMCVPQSIAVEMTRAVLDEDDDE